MLSLSCRNLAASIFCFLPAVLAFGQTKTDKKTIRQLKADIEYLTSDELSGHGTGTEGELKAANYIIRRYEELKIKPYKGSYIHPFNFVNGKEIEASTTIELGDYRVISNSHLFPLPFSANKSVADIVLPDIAEMGTIWFLPLYEHQREAADPHFNWEQKALEKSREAQKGGATGLVLYDPFNATSPPEFNKYSEDQTITIPVVFASYKVWEEQISKSGSGGMPVSMNIHLKMTERSGRNVAAFINNKAKYTVVLGAHYDYLDFREYNTGVFATREGLICSGADGNASGTAALLQLAGWTKQRRLKNYNYLFINFSGEELGMVGSKAIVKEEGMDSTSIAWMLELCTIGTLNDSTKSLTIGGVGSSPAFNDVPVQGNKLFNIIIDRKGNEPSDHASFFDNGVPVLYFCTSGIRATNRRGDDAPIINYPGEVSILNFLKDIIIRMDAAPKPAFADTQ